MSMRYIESNNAAIAQSVERLPCKQDVRGSIPRGGTKYTERQK